MNKKEKVLNCHTFHYRGYCQICSFSVGIRDYSKTTIRNKVRKHVIETGHICEIISEEIINKLK